MKRLGKIVLYVFGGALLLLLIAFVFTVMEFSPGILFILLPIAFFYGCVLFIFQHYRQGRQAEFLQLLATATESGAPLAPVLRAYLSDRPKGLVREFWVGTLLFFVLPGYYWFWHRYHSYDRKVGRVADLLEQGVPLSQALQAVPGVAPRETQLAAAVGEASGNLARCLRISTPGRLVTVWLEVMPRFLYPPLLLFCVFGITTFWTIFLLPKMEKIFSDFHEPLPPLTQYVANLGRALVQYLVYIIMGIPVILILIVAFLYKPIPLWYFPVIGRFYRLSIQGRILRMLSVLLQSGRPVPEAMRILANSETFTPEVKRRLNITCQAAEQGESLSESLQRGGFLQPTMLPLVNAAERVHNIPWALAELGETLTNRMTRVLRRLSLVVFPVCVLGIGILVGFVGIGMFYPLIRLLMGLSE